MAAMKISEVQAYVKGLIDAHPNFAAKNVKAILDDGTYPKIPGLEKTLRENGLAIIVWRIGCMGLVDTNRSGASNQLLHIAVVIQENESVNRKVNPPDGIAPVGILPEDALQYISEAVAGHPKKTPPGTPILPHSEPWNNLGKINGNLTIVVNFTKEHRITPYYEPL